MSTTSEDQFLLKNNPNLSAADLQSYHTKKTQLFKLTIAICAIYGTITLVVLLLTLFSSKGSQLFTDDIRPFTLTFVGGMIFVIILLIIQIKTFKPRVLTTSPYDGDICPDYWKLVKTNKTTDPILTNIDPSMLGLFQYKCVPDNTIYNTYRSDIDATATAAAINPYGQTIAGTTPNQYTLSTVNSNLLVPKSGLNKLVGTGTNGYLTKLPANVPGVSGGSGGFGANQIRCDEVFPNYLANKNASDPDLQQSNALAQAYAQQCGIPWTNLNGN